MTDEVQTTADPLAVAQGEFAADPAPKVVTTSEIAPDPVSEGSDPGADVIQPVGDTTPTEEYPDANPDVPDPVDPDLDPDAPDEFFDEAPAPVGGAYHHYSNPNAVRGVPAGPAPHPRTV
jgi:hypothetical protein